MAEVASYEKRFRNHWNRFLARFKITSDLRQMVYTDLHRRYGEKHRVYHGIKHPVLLLDELEIARAEMPKWFRSREQDLSIELALWEQSTFYNTRNEGNKEKSAERAIEHAHDLAISPIVGARAAQLVLATKHLKRPDELAAQIVTDIDLSPLAAPWETFAENTREIRDEYTHVSDEDFRTRREDFLKSMAKWSGIYSTNYFFMKFEPKAQANLLRSYRETFTH
jgi:predicted metal-dependent HD superfamily phosphohydrolase